MNLFLKPTKWISIAALGSLLIACSATIPSPAEQIYQAQKASKHIAKPLNMQIEQAQSIAQYHCDNNKKVTVESKKQSKATNKKETITVNFQGTSHQLSSAVTKNGKKYTNIRWTWHEMRNGQAFLYNNTKKILAENCVKQ